MGSASEQPPFPENSRRAGTEDSLLKPAMERRASFGRLQDRLCEPGRSGVSPLRCFQKAAGGRFYFGVAGVPPSGFELPSDLDGVYALGVTNAGAGDLAGATSRNFSGGQKVADRNPCNVHTMHASSYG
jgi:hypothetical protein